MIGELDIYGIFVPAIMVLLTVALLVSLAVRRLLRAVGFYGLLWHGPLFDLSLTILIAGGIVAVTGYWHPIP